MGNPNANAWTTEDLATLDRLYPDGGAEACMAAMPYRSRASIMQRASLRGLRLKRHRGGKSWTADEMKRRMERKPEGPYPWPPLDPMTLALQNFGFITRTGQLRPIVTVELEKVA